MIGNFYRPGKLYTTEPVRVNDHDFESLAEGKIVPHGLYDIHRNRGYIVLGTSHDTSEFGCACIRHWWLNYGQWDYPKATSILLLCDCGGSNNARHFIFKEDLQTLADDLGIEIRIAHYPPYTSKYNPIDSMFKFLILDFINPHKIRPYSDKHYYATHDPINGNTSIYLGSLQSS